eukprot:7389512-Prymnesium_polylepis.1
MSVVFGSGTSSGGLHQLQGSHELLEPLAYRQASVKNDSFARGVIDVVSGATRRPPRAADMMTRSLSLR